MTDGALDPIADAYPLTPLQQGMLFHILSQPDGGSYVGHISATVEGPVTQDALQAAWEVLIQRHDALRTAFLWEGLDQPMQVVLHDAPLNVAWGDADARPLDITQAPLMQVAVTPRADGRFQLDWTVHHLIADGWSAGVVLGEMLALLNGEALPDAPSFAAHAAWLDTVADQGEDPFWPAYFEGVQPQGLPPRQTNEGATGFAVANRQLRQDVTDHITTQARDHSVTTGTAIQAAFARAYGVWTGRRDVMFGLASAGRSSPIDGVEACVGLFVNTLPVRANLTDPALLQTLEAAALDLRAREHVPQSILARHSNTPAGRNMVEVVLSIRSLPDIPAAGPFSLSGFTARTPSNFPLTVEVDPNTGSLQALYDRGKLDHQTVERFMDLFEDALSGADLPTPAPVYGTKGPDLTDTPCDVLTRFAAQVAQRPDAPAVSDGATTLSIAQLNARAQSIAAHLTAAGVTEGDRVALVLPREVDFVAAVLGALMVGAAYVPVDDTYPTARIDAIVADCAPRLVLRAGDMAAIKPAPFTAVTTDPEAAAYLIYTSGSTGTPKGVVISRGALAHSQAARDAFYDAEPQAFLLMSPFAFDSSVVGLFWALTHGAHLVIAAKGAEQDMAALTQQVADNAVTHTLMLPTLYDAMCQHADADHLRSLRQVIVAGEACPHTLPAQHAALLPHCAFANEYGPTEATVWATAALNPAGSGAALGIGSAIPGMQVFVVDPSGTPLPAGETGQIALAGPQLATGYWNRPDATAAAFGTLTLPDGHPLRVYFTGDRGRITPDGQITYLGRGDRQVKIRGHRIELDEVEAALAALPDVRDVAVIAEPARPAEASALQDALARLPADVAQSLLTKAGGPA